MTLSERNIFFKIGILIAFLLVICMLITTFLIFPAYSRVLTETTPRSMGIVQASLVHFSQPDPYVPFVSIIGAMIYACVTIIIIYRYFEKTQSPEILYIAFFVLSFALEGSRIIIPLKLWNDLPSLYLIIASRILLFGRYFGIFSLFAASVYASGLEVQKQGNTIFIIVLGAMAIAFKVPIDGSAWDSSLCMISGYTPMFKIVESGMVLITVVSFFIAAYSRRVKEYIPIGIGSLLVIAGRNMLFTADTWISPLPGLLFLALGTWFICTRLHQVYLWL